MGALTNRVILITGATSGIGRELALALGREEGAKLSVCGRSPEKMAALMKELPRTSPDSFYQRTFCVSQEEQIVSFVAETEDRFGPIDILINCAGVNTARGSIAEINSADLDWMLAINLRAPMIFMRECFKQMRDRRQGQIVNVLSTVCLFSNEGIGAYTATKAGLDALTKVVRKEARGVGVKVTSIYPGGVNTSFRSQAREDYLSARSVAEAIITILKVSDNAAVHELVLRPMIEQNFS